MPFCQERLNLNLSLNLILQVACVLMLSVQHDVMGFSIIDTS